jgi:glucoamylase
MSDDESRNAPGGPGIPARWTSSAKSGVGTAAGAGSRVWFTLSHGVVNEVYYPRVDQACTRDLGLVVTDGRQFFSEEKRHTRHEIAMIGDGIPAFALTNTCTQGRYRVHKEVLADPARDVVLQRIRFEPLVGALSDFKVHVLLAPHLGNHGDDNTAWIGEHKGAPMLLATRDGIALALASSAPWSVRSAGYVGASDGWRDLKLHGALHWSHARAERGNVALVGEVDLAGGDGTFVLALGFGSDADEAGHRALASLFDGVDRAAVECAEAWRAYQRELLPLGAPDRGGERRYRVSTAVLRTHESKRFAGGIIASLSVPWGFSKGDGDLGGYHLAWPRDLVESAGGLLAAGAVDEALRVLAYLAVTQESDGHWPQNMWLDGRPYWNGIQMDETGFPVLLVDLALREGALDRKASSTFWPMVRRAAGYLARNGPVTQQDRWEEDPGYSPFTLAVEIAALLAAADLADTVAESEIAKYLRETADAWNACVERWTWVTGTELARNIGVEGYYVRIAPPDCADAASPVAGFVPIKNRPPGSSDAAASHIVSPDALALVRLGLRAADDPRIVATAKVIDALLRVELPGGPSWLRYNEDGYGEHEDGRPFDGTGVGRPWPLLTGERAHFELAAGRTESARALLATFESFAGDRGLLPEQVWDGPDLPARELIRGRPSGSAMPLVWAHAEHVKLLRSLRDGRVFDMPPQPVRRYQVEKVGSALVSWRFNHKLDGMPVGKTLRVEVLAASVVRFTTDGWQTQSDRPTRDTGLGIHIVDLPTADLAPGSEVSFTFHWVTSASWEGTDFTVRVEAGEGP